MDLFLEIEPLALAVVDGYNSCIFAYGQTGSGKTYTMHGPPPGTTTTVTISGDQGQDGGQGDGMSVISTSTSTDGAFEASLGRRSPDTPPDGGGGGSGNSGNGGGGGGSKGGGGRGVNYQHCGISHRTLHKVFQLLHMHQVQHRAQSQAEFHFDVRVAMLEIYNGNPAVVSA